MGDSETNLRTVRIKTEKHANLRNNEREELEDQIDKYAKKIFELENENKSLDTTNNEQRKELNVLSERQKNLEARNAEVEEDNRNLAYELKHALKEVEQMDYDEVDEEAADDESVEKKILELESRIEVNTTFSKRVKMLKKFSYLIFF